MEILYQTMELKSFFGRIKELWMKFADTLNDVCRDVHNNIPHFMLSQKIFSMLAFSGTPSLASVPSRAAKTSRTL